MSGAISLSRAGPILSGPAALLLFNFAIMLVNYKTRYLEQWMYSIFGNRCRLGNMKYSNFHMTDDVT